MWIGVGVGISIVFSWVSYAILIIVNYQNGGRQSKLFRFSRMHFLVCLIY